MAVQQKKRDLIALASIPLIMTLGNSMLIPILPSLRKELQVSSLQVSLIITVYSVVAILLIPLAGFLSDRVGRKKVIIPCLAITGAGGLIAGLAPLWSDHTYGWILGGRVLQGIGAAGSAPVVIPLVGDMFKKESDVSAGLGLIETANTFGKVLSPILGSLLAVLAWYLPFLAIPVISAISLLMVAVLVRVPRRQEQPETLRQFFSEVKAVFNEKGRWLYAIFAVGGICMFLVFSFLFFLSQILEDRYNVHGAAKGGLLAIPTAALCLCSFTAGKWIGENKRRMKWLNFAGAAVAAAAMFICGFFRIDSVFMLFILIAIGGAGIGAALPCLDAMVTEGIDKKQRGTVTSIFSSIRFIGVAAGPPASSVLLEYSQRSLFFVMAAVGTASALLALIAIRPHSSEPNPGEIVQRFQPKQKNRRNRRLRTKA
ncbi:MFS transporter [Cohnella lubricantis]|uniref:MFS transporter n=1 Tax=Cohnella lubricantis TaxID=2163172 RepID=A0A841T8L0_9BACL|nr:MFS transporter [Cohnella lubricantis]MBB6677843.1 MFS transporter [Cohnella lubricantis]MBP2119022.1 ACDE family multidrug resistance protein [Cohnella lubricantis]